MRKIHIPLYEDVFENSESLDCEDYEGYGFCVGYCKKKDSLVSRVKECVDCKYEEVMKERGGLDE